MVRAPASHQCDPASTPSVDAICGLSLLLVLSFAPRDFSPNTPFSPLLKTNTSKFQFDLGRTDTFKRVHMNSYVLRGKQITIYNLFFQCAAVDTRKFPSLSPSRRYVCRLARAAFFPC